MSLFSEKNLSQNTYFKILNSIQSLDIKYKAPLILRIYGTLNKLDLHTENRYILCNFLDQYGDLIGFDRNIYVENNSKSLNQLFLIAYRKAKEAKLLNELYREYLDSFKAICKKKDMEKSID
ncbi:MAG: hypothetical protein BAJALOKI3v1_680025 [Promethearchaeota archaeon]|jgi:hypothetical protein|nr:MAG: hypothetical protein BAJALOKI3v1_680025 [Candidatus Lokiarchaeota archaeon]